MERPRDHCLRLDMLRITTASGFLASGSNMARDELRGSTVALDGVEGALASNFSITTADVRPVRSSSTPDGKRCGIGAGLRYTESASVQNRAAGIIPRVSGDVAIAFDSLGRASRSRRYCSRSPAFVLDRGVR